MSFAMQELRIRKLDAAATLPTRAHPGDAGLDLYALEDQSIQPGQGVLARTGISAAIDDGYVGLVCDRSSLAKRGLKTMGGVIDAGYRGEICVVLWNISRDVQSIKAGERVGQLLIAPIASPRPVEVEALEATARGANGFGSTGR